MLKEEGGRERKNMNMNMNVCGAEEEKGGKVVPGEHRGPVSCRNSIPAAGGLQRETLRSGGWECEITVLAASFLLGSLSSAGRWMSSPGVFT